MKHMKKILPAFLALVIVLGLSCGIAAARGSHYLAAYWVKMSAGDTKGALLIEYDVMANEHSDCVGVSHIKIYRSDGTYITTITGTTANNLLREGAAGHAGQYTHYGISGNYYYAVIRVYAERDGGSDYRDITTATVKAP